MHCSYCGKDCGSCAEKNEYGCVGCRDSEDGYWGSRCEIKQCCEEKKLEHCGLCADFPCELLREFCYDKETGDDGDRLLNCKKWADDDKTAKENRVRRFANGVTLGILGGVVAGEIQGNPAAWIFCGAAVGFGISLMLEISKKK